MIPNPRSNRAEYLQPIQNWKTKRLARRLLRWLVIVILIALLSIVVCRQTQMRQFFADMTLELGIVECDLYIDQKRDVWSLICRRK